MKKTTFIFILIVFSFLLTSGLSAQSEKITGGAGIIAFADGETKDRLGPDRLSEIAESWADNPGFLSIIVRPYERPPWCLQFVYTTVNGKTLDDIIAETEDSNGIYSVRIDFVYDFIMTKSIAGSAGDKSSQFYSAGTIAMNNSNPGYCTDVANKLAEYSAFSSVINKGDSIQFVFNGSEDELYEILDNIGTKLNLEDLQDIGYFDVKEYLIIQREMQ